MLLCSYIGNYWDIYIYFIVSNTMIFLCLLMLFSFAAGKTARTSNESPSGIFQESPSRSWSVSAAILLVQYPTDNQ